jgi:hypothetical protein
VCGTSTRLYNGDLYTDLTMVTCTMEHIRVVVSNGDLERRLSKSPLDTKVAIVFPYWPKFKVLTKDLKLIKQLPKGKKVCMRTTPIGTYDPPDNITSAWVIN